MSKHIFITGGVVSSLGKGINAASIGQILKSRGLKVFVQKFDPYINVDPGTMSPFQHGEIYVTKDGAETDLDLGHYERFIDVELTKESSVSTGKIYQAVINKERAGLYDGATIQVIPHITDEIKLRLKDAADKSNADIIITEIGGTVGDIESLPYLEAIRQARSDFGYENTLYIHNTLIPYLKAAKEIKTKPTQHSISELKSLGIEPDILMLRSEVDIPNHAIEKISLFSGIKKEAIFKALDVDVIYEPIISMEAANIDDLILDHFKIKDLPKANLTEWQELITNIKTLKDIVTVTIVGKYVSHQDAYLSLIEALKHAGFKHHVKVKFDFVDSSEITKSNYKEVLSGSEAIIVPGGFGEKATNGKLLAIEYARVNKIIFLGICYGMQLTLIEYARNVLGLKDANSTEIDQLTKSPLFIKNNKRVLGEYQVLINEGSKLSNIYGVNLINERFRNDYKFNYDFLKIFQESKDLKLTAFNKEILSAIELTNHPFFISVQYHPEYLSRPLKPHPLFLSFIKTLKEKQLVKEKSNEKN